ILKIISMAAGTPLAHFKMLFSQKIALGEQNQVCHDKLNILWNCSSAKYEKFCSGAGKGP
ncbi:MAG: hypothetical protein AB2693_17635, partial [Candidatus Thiodiazotropha sp.]